MKTTSVILLDEDLGEEDEVGGGGVGVEVVEVAATQEVDIMEMAMAPHLIHLPVNRAMSEGNLRVLREDWEVGTAMDSQAGVELLGEWSLLEHDELVEETIIVLSFSRNRFVAKCSSIQLSVYPFDVAYIHLWLRDCLLIKY